VTEFKPGLDAEGKGPPRATAQELARTTACQEAHPPVFSQLNSPAVGSLLSRILWEEPGRGPCWTECRCPLGAIPPRWVEDG
jgi:hypothetical protein